MRVPGKIFGKGFVVLLLLSGCEAKGPKSVSKANPTTTQVEPSVQTKQNAALRRTPDPELLARPPSHPISLIEVESPPRADVHPPAPFPEVTRATGGGILRLEGQCLFLESGADKVGLVFKNPAARFDPASNELVVSGVRVPVGEAMFVRALWWGGPSFSGFELRPLPSEQCARNHYWLVDSIGAGTPASEDLNCEGDVDAGRAHKVMMDDFVVQGGLEPQAKRTLHEWRRNFGIVRVCVEKHFPPRIGTLIDEPLTVNISKEGHAVSIAFQDNKHADVVECMKGHLAEKTPFSPAREASELTLRLRVLLGNSDYQIDACDHLRSGERRQP